MCVHACEQMHVSMCVDAHVCMCTCMCVCVLVYVCLHVCTCMWACVWVHMPVYELAKTQKSIQSTVLYSSPSYFLAQALSQNLELSVPANLAGRQDPSHLQVATATPALGLETHSSNSGFYVGSGDLSSSGPHPYSASMRPTEQSLWPSSFPLPAIWSRHWQ